MFEVSLLKALLDKEVYQLYRSYLSFSDFPKELTPVVQAIDELHKISDQKVLSPLDVANVVYARGIPDKNKEYLSGVFTALTSHGGEETIGVLLDRVKKRATSLKMAVAAMNYAEGRGSIQEILSLAKILEEPVISEEIELVTDNLQEILSKLVHKPGLRWRLSCLNKSLGSLRKGNFGFIFARPETGKTTFLASEVTHMASQLKEEDGPILWLNNEEQGDVVRLRQYQAALGARLEHLKSRPERAYQAFKEKTKGKIFLVDSPILTKDKVSKLAFKYKPSLIVVDQLDKVSGFESDREDLKLGSIYQWARELAKEYCPVIGVCQADGTAEGVKYLTMGHVSNAKTAKQAEADWILGIGRDNSPGYDYVRFLSILKNKLVGDDDTDQNLRHAQFQVEIQPEIARYRDLE